MAQTIDREKISGEDFRLRNRRNERLFRSGTWRGWGLGQKTQRKLRQ